MKFRIIILLAFAAGIISSCSTIQTGAGSSSQSGQTESTCTLLIRLEDNGGTMNHLMDQIHRFFFPLDIQVINNSTLFDNTKEVRVITDNKSDKGLNSIQLELYRIAGVVSVNIYKN